MQLLPQIFRRSPEDADAEINRLLEREQELVAERQAKAQEIAALEQRIGQEYLDGDGEASLTDLTRLRVQVEAINRAIIAARDRRLEATRAKVRGRAGQIRRQAEEKKAELDTLNSETGALLRKLAELEGVDYDHSILSSQRCGDWYSLPNFRRPPEEWLGPSDVSPDPSNGRYQTPRSRRLREEIESLFAEAAKVEAEVDRITLEEASGIGDRSAAA
ncbi:MAG: hypothetical protein IT165_06655 [Bryobacterales bacterium]|nr:hypothetical protein [Bryobacterales bacterium]